MPKRVKAKKFSFLSFFKFFFLTLLIITVLCIFYIFIVLQPTNRANWEVGYETLPRITIDGNLVGISNFRDNQILPDKNVSFNFVDRVVDVDKIRRAWFVVEPFEGSKGAAHTYFVFDFEDSEPLVVSVEARRQKGQQFSAFQGIFNQFGLIYVWGSEKDITGRRVLLEENKIYMYPLTISLKSTKQLFMQMITVTKDLENNPRFYNSLTSNCTNELAKVANSIRPGSIPWDISFWMPEYSPELLYKLGFIPNHRPFEQVKNNYEVSSIVKQVYFEPDFSIKLRSILSSRAI